MSLFFDRLTELCRENDTSPNAVAKKLGISSGSITAWKKGTYPRMETLQKLADYFHVSADYLIGNVNEPFFYLDNERILKDINSYGDTAPSQAAQLTGTYLRLAQGAQELGLDDDDVDAILALYKAHKRRNE